jgi:hypothetical protein
MSYYNAARKVGACKDIDCEANDYLYDAPQLSSNCLQQVQGTSYYDIASKAQALKKYDAGLDHATPDAWEDLLFSIPA